MRGRRDRMAVGFTTTYGVSGYTSEVVRSNPAQAICSQ